MRQRSIYFISDLKRSRISGRVLVGGGGSLGCFSRPTSTSLLVTYLVLWINKHVYETSCHELIESISMLRNQRPYGR